MACEYCNGDKCLINRGDFLSRKGDFYPGIELCVEDGRLFIDAVADVYEPNFTEADIEINFCPMCGEKLVKS